MTDEASDVLSVIISCEISTYEYTYGPDKAVVPISDLVAMLKITKYRARKALKELRELGLIEYTSQGRPAIVSTIGEYGQELICEAMPPINGYALTEKGFETELYKQKYAKWQKDLEEWANDKNNV